ncbi:myosin-10-like [Callorhinchus milii]|uniref:myosin-10-like n=1 Tax=Callorhinchus milii TaxID=7868 RepID=UPI0004572D60|nr:myosin-10-like [Callorhinchus milii]|eukprot:gi/632953374/ref/XP_007892383.1/ PREDICTED: nuclear mitotic apparatus protein 1-like [Callorhinchus milii]
MRNRKGKNSPKNEEIDSQGVPEAPSVVSVALLWVCLVLLTVSCALGGWYLDQKLRAIGNLDQTIHLLREKMSRLEKIQAQVNELNEKLIITHKYEERILNLETSQSQIQKRVEAEAAEITRMQSSDVASKLSALQAETRQSLVELSELSPTRSDLQVLKNSLNLFRTTNFAKLQQEVTGIKSDDARREEGLTTLSASLSSLASRLASLEEDGRSLQALRQNTQEVGALKETVGKSTESLTALNNQLTHAARLTEALQSQGVQHGKEILGLKEAVSAQQAEQLSNKQELANIREVAQELRTGKSAVEEQVNTVSHSVADNTRELQSAKRHMEELSALLQSQIAKVETDGIDRNKQFSAVIDQAFQTLSQSVGKIEVGLKNTVEQCLSGEVRSFCETPDNCSWPHIREVNFPHRILKDPVILLSLTEVGSDSSIGVTVKAIDVTDSGFNIQIDNVGDFNLSTVRVNWIACA